MISLGEALAAKNHQFIFGGFPKSPDFYSARQLAMAADENFEGANTLHHSC